jgi:proteic killer suppression protein
LAIRSFKDRRTEAAFRRLRPKAVPPDVMRRLEAKLAVLHKISELAEIGLSPGAQLERLAGDRYGQYSIRVNRQWRLCFRWLDGDAYEVEFVDYH